MTPVKPHYRTPEQRQSDFHNARIWETEVSNMFSGEPFIVDFDAIEKVDMWFPGTYLELKEKRKPYGNRWHVLPGVPEENLFILDELTVKRSLQHYPEVLFLLRDVPGGMRLFYAPLWMVVAAEHVCLNRMDKGKWVLDVTNFPLVESPVAARRRFHEDLVSMEWKQPRVASVKEIPQVPA